MLDYDLVLSFLDFDLNAPVDLWGTFVKLRLLPNKQSSHLHDSAEILLRYELPRCERRRRLSSTFFEVVVMVGEKGWTAPGTLMSELNDLRQCGKRRCLTLPWTLATVILAPLLAETAIFWQLCSRFYISSAQSLMKENLPRSFINIDHRATTISWAADVQ